MFAQKIEGARSRRQAVSHVPGLSWKRSGARERERGLGPWAWWDPLGSDPFLLLDLDGPWALPTVKLPAPFQGACPCNFSFPGAGGGSPDPGPSLGRKSQGPSPSPGLRAGRRIADSLSLALDMARFFSRRPPVGEVWPPTNHALAASRILPAHVGVSGSIDPPQIAASIGA
jgi:hypothetical protein